MGLISEEVEINLSNRIIRYYENLGYEIPKYVNYNNIISVKKGTKIIVKPEHLLDNSHIKVDVQCDSCGKILKVFWRNYKNYSINNKYYCNNCAKKLYSGESQRLTKLQNSISFAQWGIDNIGENFLDKYWSNKNTFNPWGISYGSKKKVWIKCQEKDYHEDYNIICNCFTLQNQRCPYCCNYHGRVNLKDSLGQLLENKNLLSLWSDKNKKTPYEYSPGSGQKVWWKCPEGKHKDTYGIVNNARKHNFRCPECQYSYGEEIINNYLMENNINFEPQKEFDGLLGLGNGNLSYDFYFPDYNLLIEYQGEQHENYRKGFHKSKKDFEKQQEHDRRKKEYAKNNNINLLEIWYWDFDNVEEILEKELNYYLTTHSVPLENNTLVNLIDEICVAVG